AAERDDWFRAGLNGPADADPDAGGEPGWVVRQAALEPLRLVLVPRAVWLPACALAALAAGLVLLALRPAAAAALLGLLAVGVATAAGAWAPPTPPGRGR